MALCAETAHGRGRSRGGGGRSCGRGGRSRSGCGHWQVRTHAGVDMDAQAWTWAVTHSFPPSHLDHFPRLALRRPRGWWSSILLSIGCIPLQGGGDGGASFTLHLPWGQHQLVLEVSDWLGSENKEVPDGGRTSPSKKHTQEASFQPMGPWCVSGCGDPESLWGGQSCHGTTGGAEPQSLRASGFRTPAPPHPPHGKSCSSFSVPEPVTC